ncbi:MAG TPA: protein translocase subunit SecDF, partial [Desulfobacteraceae bacterium]|nr:protein translocase subunit SecDF [Desulfobacteraceae bacterium]
MNTTMKLKIALMAGLVLFSIMAIVPSFYKGAPSWWKTYLAPQGIKLGLDLQGGMHLVLRVELDKAVENSLNLAASDLKDALADKHITVVRMPSSNPQQITFTLPNTGAVNTVNEVIKNDFPGLDIKVLTEQGSFPRIILKLKQDKINFIRKNAVNQSLEIIRNRIDQFGVAEPVIIRQGDNEIVVELPGIKNPKRAISLIGQTAQLEFKMVADDSGLNLPQLISDAVKAGQWKPGESREQLNLALQNRLPPGTEIYFQRFVDKQTKRV